MNAIPTEKFILALASLSLLAIGACSDNAPPPKATVQAAQPAAPAIAPASEARVQTVAAVSQPAPPKPSPDRDLAERVRKALESEPTHTMQGVDVSASGGVVRLWGTVPSSAARAAAAKIASLTPGVSSVENKVIVLKGS